MATVILVRHGRTSANASGVLAGRTPGVRLDETGTGQARRTGERLAVVPLARVVSSPLERCKQTSREILRARPLAEDPVPLSTERGLAECDYGEWQGRPLRELAKEDLWRTVQAQPSAVTFPGGESMTQMHARVVAAVRRHDREVTEAHGEHAVWVAVSHGDLIKAVLADALGLHLDLFQRITVDPASVSIVRYTGARPYVVSSNTHAGDLSWLRPPPPKQDDAEGDGGGEDAGGAGDAGASDDAAVGGGAGPSGAL